MSKVWFITGSSRGLGLALTTAVLESGASVIATARTPSQLQHLAQKYGDRILPLALDVTNNDNVVQAVQAGIQKFGHIDVLVNNAGYADTAAIEEISIASFQAQMNANFYGVVYVTKAILPHLRSQGSGHIFQISSLGGRVGSPGLAAYQSAKWAVGGFSTILAKEVAPFGIKVTVLEPGGIRTDWAGKSMEVLPVSEPYEGTVGVFAKMIKGFNGKEPTLPEKLAGLIVRLEGMGRRGEEVPFRLLVGPDAVEYGASAGEELAKNDRKWRELSLSCGGSEADLKGVIEKA